MKRRPHAWLALLLAVAATAVAFVRADPAEGDVECRYGIKPAPLLLPADQGEDVDGVGQTPPHQRMFFMQRPRWSVIAIRPAIGTDYDMRVDECPERPLAGSVTAGPAVEFVAIDGNRPWTITPGTEKPLFLSVWRGGTVTGPFRLEYSTGGTLVAGSQQFLRLQATPAVVRDVTVLPGQTAVLTLRHVRGDADLALVDSTTDPATWGRGRHQAIARSVNPGTLDERIVVSVPSTATARTFGLVVINNSPYGEYTLTRS